MSVFTRLDRRRKYEKSLHYERGHAVAQLVEALRYKSEGRGYDPRWRDNPSGRTMAMRSTQPPREMSTRNTSWG
jgi:hypothetical protein